MSFNPLVLFFVSLYEVVDFTHFSSLKAAVADKGEHWPGPDPYLTELWILVSFGE